MKDAVRASKKKSWEFIEFTEQAVQLVLCLLSDIHLYEWQN